MGRYTMVAPPNGAPWVHRWECNVAGDVGAGREDSFPRPALLLLRENSDAALAVPRCAQAAPSPDGTRVTASGARRGIWPDDERHHRVLRFQPRPIGRGTGNDPFPRYPAEGALSVVGALQAQTAFRTVALEHARERPEPRMVSESASVDAEGRALGIVLSHQQTASQEISGRKKCPWMFALSVHVIPPGALRRTSHFPVGMPNDLGTKGGPHHPRNIRRSGIHVRSGARVARSPVPTGACANPGRASSLRVLRHPTSARPGVTRAAR